jgi:hypothetical protein
MVSKPLKKLYFVALAAALAPAAEARVDVRFSPEGDLLGAARLELGTAEQRIDLALSDLTSAELVAVAADMARQGRAVRVVTRAAASCAPCEQLERAGADVRFVGPTLLHQFAIVDGPRGRKATAAKSRLALLQGARDPREPRAAPGALLALEDEGDTVLAYQDEFNFLWGRGRDYKSPAKHAKIAHVRAPVGSLAIFTSKNVIPTPVGKRRWLFSPAADAHEGGVARHLVGAIDAAFDTIDLSASAFGRADLTLALQRALERGVRVRLLLPGESFQGLTGASSCTAVAMSESLSKMHESADECLATAGADVRYFASGVRGPEAPLMTYAVIDGRRALVGNFGIDADAETKSFGSLLSLRGDAARAYARHFAERFGSQPREGSKLVSAAAGAASVGDACAFPPVALRGAELAAARQREERDICTQ